MIDDVVTWKKFFADSDTECTFCGELVDDRRYAVGLVMRRAWEPGSVEYRFGHVQCLRKAMHHSEPLG